MTLERIRGAFPGRRIEYFTTIDSTMRVAAGLDPGSVVLAGEQTAGQGRHGHTWYSEAGAGIYCSVVMEPAELLTLRLGLAVAEAITETIGLACDLRWPNDVLLDGRKCAGILVQLIDGKAITGTGINVAHTSFPPALAADATSLRMHSRREICKDDLVISLLGAIGHFAALPQADILRLFTHASSFALGRRVVVHQPDGDIFGITAGLNDCGFLRLRKDDGTDTLILAGGVRAAGS